MMNQRKNILFLCTGNSCRSQMAEGWAKLLKADSLNAFSAGVKPQGLNPLAVRVMAEVGVDISSQTSKHLDTLAEQSLDYIITVCDSANSACPATLGTTKKMHVGFDDPPKLAENAKTEDEALNCYRRVRDEIRAFIATLPESLN